MFSLYLACLGFGGVLIATSFLFGGDADKDFDKDFDIDADVDVDADVDADADADVDHDSDVHVAAYELRGGGDEIWTRSTSHLVANRCETGHESFNPHTIRADEDTSLGAALHATHEVRVTPSRGAVELDDAHPVTGKHSATLRGLLIDPAYDTDATVDGGISVVQREAKY